MHIVCLRLVHRLPFWFKSMRKSANTKVRSSFFDWWLRSVLIFSEFLDDFPHDSGYSSHQERAPLLLPPPSSSSISHYEPLSDCYSGYSFIPSDFLPTTHQFSSIHSNTDEAYESEPTTMSSSIITSHVHPQLEHEFEYPSPPPPVPDRRLKPAHLTSTSRQETIRYSTIEKVETYSSMKNRNSRDFCGVIPSMEESPSSRTKEKRNHKTLNCLQSSTKEDKKIKVSLLGKSKSKKQQRKDFDEATNGLAICFPASDRKSSIERLVTFFCNQNRDRFPSLLERRRNPRRQCVSPFMKHRSRYALFLPFYVCVQFLCFITGYEHDLARLGTLHIILTSIDAFEEKHAFERLWWKQIFMHDDDGGQEWKEKHTKLSNWSKQNHWGNETIQLISDKEFQGLLIHRSIIWKKP